MNLLNNQKVKACSILGKFIEQVHLKRGLIDDVWQQIMTKAIGLSVGGKIGIARYHDHLSIAVFLGIGLLHLDEVAVGLAHRTIS